MVGEEEASGIGKGRVIFVGIACLAAGLGFGRWMTKTSISGECEWRALAEIQRLFMVPRRYSFAESNKSSGRNYNNEPL